MSRTRALSPLLLVLSALVGSGPAAASSNYPSAVKSHLSAEASPPCTACHASNAGGFGTITAAFGIALTDNGLVAGDVDSLNAALDAVEAAGTDSDGDGVGDIDEVRIGADPNDAADEGKVGGGDAALLYGFGCGAASAPVALVLLLLGLARRRGTGRRSRISEVSADRGAA